MLSGSRFTVPPSSPLFFFFPITEREICRVSCRLAELTRGLMRESPLLFNVRHDSIASLALANAWHSESGKYLVHELRRSVIRNLRQTRRHAGILFPLLKISREISHSVFLGHSNRMYCTIKCTTKERADLKNPPSPIVIGKSNSSYRSRSDR